MAVTVYWFDRAFMSALTNSPAAKVDLVNDVIQITLHTSLPDRRANRFWNDVLATELATANATNYTTSSGDGSTGGKVLPATRAVNYDGAGNVTYAAGTVTYSSLTTTTPILCAIISDRSPGTNATRPLIAYVDFGASQSPGGGDFVISWAAFGAGTAIARLTFP